MSIDVDAIPSSNRNSPRYMSQSNLDSVSYEVQRQKHPLNSLILSYYDRRKDPLQKKSANIHNFLDALEKELAVTDVNCKMMKG